MSKEQSILPLPFLNIESHKITACVLAGEGYGRKKFCRLFFVAAVNQQKPCHPFRSPGSHSHESPREGLGRSGDGRRLSAALLLFLGAWCFVAFASAAGW